MILADKIIKLRKQKGWSQEELAEKMEVSRQAVSKWESAQATPDIEKILALGELFGVSTDYLLKDEIEECPLGTEEQKEALPALRHVSLTEATEYVESRKKASWKIALATFLCILSPITMIILGGAADTGILHMSENLMGAIGLGVLFLFVIAALPFFIYSGIKNEPYKFLENNGAFESDTEAAEAIRKLKKDFQGTYAACNIVATCLCAASPVPLLIGAFTEREFLTVIMLGITIALNGIGVFLFILVGVRQASMQRLLKAGEFAPKEKKKKTLVETVETVYWSVLVAAFLAWGFIGNGWYICWILFPIGGVLFAGIRAILNLVIDKKQ